MTSQFEVLVCSQDALNDLVSMVEMKPISLCVLIPDSHVVNAHHKKDHIMWVLPCMSLDSRSGGADSRASFSKKCQSEHLYSWLGWHTVREIWSLSPWRPLWSTFCSQIALVNRIYAYWCLLISNLKRTRKDGGSSVVLILCASSHSAGYFQFPVLGGVLVVLANVVSIEVLTV